MDINIILTIVSAVLTLVAVVAGTFWAKAKGKFSQVVNLVKETMQVGDALNKALEDDKITEAEIAELKTQWAELKAAWKLLVSKS